MESSAITSYFLQSCDQDVKKRFSDTIRIVRDKFCLASRGTIDTRAIQAKHMFATPGLGTITHMDIRRCSDVTGLWPMDYRFTKKYMRNKDEMVLKATEEFNAL